MSVPLEGEGGGCVPGEGLQVPDGLAALGKEREAAMPEVVEADGGVGRPVEVRCRSLRSTQLPDRCVNRLKQWREIATRYEKPQQKGSAGDDTSLGALGRHVMIWAVVVPKVELGRRWHLCVR